jgi:hypothetical protein
MAVANATGMKALLIITLPVLAIAAIILIALQPPERGAPPARAAPPQSRVAMEVSAPESGPIAESAPASRPIDVASTLEPATSDGGAGIDGESLPSEPHATIHKTEDR